MANRFSQLLSVRYIPLGLYEAVPNSPPPMRGQQEQLHLRRLRVLSTQQPPLVHTTGTHTIC